MIKLHADEKIEKPICEVYVEGESFKGLYMCASKASAYGVAIEILLEQVKADPGHPVTMFTALLKEFHDMCNAIRQSPFPEKTNEG